MNNESYERYQLELIAQEYREKGFDVLLDSHATTGNYRFDAVATRKGSDKLVVIELVNKSLSKAHALERLNVIEKFAAGHPDAVVDFRYIDVEYSRLRQWHQLVGEDHKIDLWDLVRKRITRPPFDVIGGPMHFMQIWALHAATIRSFGQIRSTTANQSNDKGVLDIYNELLEFELLAPPEDLVDDVSLNLFELHEAALAVAEGATINGQYLHDLYQHLLSVRKQIRRFMRHPKSVASG